MFVGVPNDNYQIDVIRTDGPEAPLVTIQRDWAYEKKHESKDAHTVWVSPYTEAVYKHKFSGVLA